MSSIKRLAQGSSNEDYGAGKKPRKENDKLDYGSDDELPVESVENRLSWRTEDSFTDWKIVITMTKSPNDEGYESEGEGDGVESKSEGDNEEKTYNVHRNVLAFGPRQSDYFVTLFQQDGPFAESQDNTSRIELHKLQAKAFPDLLDYMYSVGQQVSSFTTDTATALYSLAKYFGVRRLQNEAKKFCLNDMQHPYRCGTYYEHATILHGEVLRQAAAKFCLEYIKSIEPGEHVANPQVWLDLMKDHAEKETIFTLGMQLSSHIAQFCWQHADVLSMDIFKQLTNEKYLPECRIHTLSAVILLESERRIIENNDKKQGGGEDALSSLQARCANAIAREKASMSSLNKNIDDDWAWYFSL